MCGKIKAISLYKSSRTLLNNLFFFGIMLRNTGRTVHGKKTIPLMQPNFRCLKTKRETRL